MKVTRQGVVDKTTVTGTVNVGNLPSIQPVKDDYANGQYLADQAGAGAVLTFTFTNPVSFIWVNDIGSGASNISRVDPFGGTPAVSTGIAVPNGTPTPIFVTPPSTTIKVYAPTNSTISMYGHGR